MALTKFNGPDNNIRTLADKPNLTASELKSKFDKTGADLKNYINDTLTEELDNQLSGKVDKVQGKSLISDEKIEKLDSLPTNSELELKFSQKVDKEDGKTLIDSERLSKLDSLPTKTKLDEEFDNKADKEALSNVANALNDKADKSQVYSALLEKANKDEIPKKVSDLVNDSGFISSHQDISGKVDKEAGKGLSSNDYTNDEKAKLQGIENGAEVNVLDGVQINGTDLPISDKKVNIPNATNEGTGVVKGSYDKGIIVNSDGTLEICEALPGNINLKEHFYPITPYNLDYAVRSVRPEISSDDSGALSVNTIYDMGTQASLTLTLPTNPEYGDFVQVDLLTGENPLNLTVESALGLADIDFTPDTNKIYSLFFDYGRIGSDLWGWRFSYAEYQDSEV